MSMKIAIAPFEFQESLQELVGKDIKKFYYITDSMVVFKFGNEYLRPLENHPVYDSEYELRVNGPWNYVENDKVLMTTVANDEDLPTLRLRIGDFIESLHPSKINSIKISPDGLEASIEMNTGGKFVITKNEEMFISYSHKVYDAEGKFVSNTIVGPDEDTGELVKLNF